MPTVLDQILEVLIPIIMVGLFCMVIYRAFKEPFDALGAKIKGWFQPKEEDGEMGYEMMMPKGYEIQYQE